MRNLKTGASYEVRFNSQASVERATLEQHQMEYLYTDGTLYHFMNIRTYEQIALDDEALGDFRNYLKEGQQIEVEFYEVSMDNTEIRSNGRIFWNSALKLSNASAISKG